jgi:hypothetical protein
MASGRGLEGPRARSPHHRLPVVQARAQRRCSPDVDGTIRTDRRRPQLVQKGAAASRSTGGADSARRSPIRAHQAMAEVWLPFRHHDQPVEQSLDALLAGVLLRA